MTTANKITLVRIALIPVFMVLASLEQSWAPWAAFCVFAVAGLTDGLDGHIARKYNQVSAFGKFVDPLADKLLVFAALLLFVADGRMPVWSCMLILTRELVVSSLRMVAAVQGVVIQASIWGKIKTFSHMICILLLLAGFDRLFNWMVPVCAWVMALTAVISGVIYIRDNFAVVRDGVSAKEK